MVRKPVKFHAARARVVGIAVALWRCMGRSAIIVALVAGALAGCGGNPGGNPPPDAGTLTLTITPTSPATSPLALQQARLKLDNVSLVGDVVPDGRSMLSDVSIDLLSSGMSFAFTMLPQGVYSRVRFTVDNVAMQGTWRGVPLTIQLEPLDGSSIGVVDLRSSAGVEVAPGHDVTIPVVIDAASWFGGALLDSATQSSGQIVVDANNNVAIVQQLLSRIAPSFSWQGQPVQ